LTPCRPGRGLRAMVAASVGLRGQRAPPARAASSTLGAPLGWCPAGCHGWLPGEQAVQATSPERASRMEVLQAAMGELRSSAVVAIPTDRLYGLACSVSGSAALDAVYHLKGHSKAKPLAVCLGCVVDIYRYYHVKVPKGLLKDLLPGPVTLVLECLKELNKDLNPFTPPVSIWIPDHAFMHDLAQMFVGLLALTCANLSSQPSSLNVEEFQNLWPQLSLGINGGPIGDGKSPKCCLGSNVVDLSVPGKFGIIGAGCAWENTMLVLQRKYRLLPHRDPAETW
uniref:Threonylcarbamoyl-AMP synthase n=1 Tax=Myotis lucifugus TaxID=59463 RepID=G1PZ19_MYOLU